MRRTLVAALVSCAGDDTKFRLRRFLAGLSADELQFLAGFQGARILERSAASTVAPTGHADYGFCTAGPPSADHDHKMLVLREYLARCGRLASSDSPPCYHRASTAERRPASGLA